MLLPFFVLPVAADMTVQFDLPKLMGIFLLGNLILARSLSRISVLFALIHGGIALSTIITGFSCPQIYFYVYWTSAAIVGAWFASMGEEQREEILTFVVIGGVLVAAHGYLQVAWRDPVLHYAPGINPHRPIAFLRQHTLFGAFEAPVCCLALALRRWKSAIFIAPLLAIAHSNFTLLAFGAGLFVVLLDWEKGGKIAAAFTAVGATVLGILCWLRPQTFYSHGRVDVWRETLSWWWNHARWVGMGGGSFRILYPPRLTPDYQLIPHTGIQGEQLYSHGAFWWAHNDYIQALFEFGLSGGALMLAVILGVFWALWNGFQFKGKRRSVLGCQAMLAAFMANALGNFPWQIAPHCLLAVISLATVLHEDNL